MSNTWKSHLQRLAREKGMCADNRAYLNACENKEDAIRLYKQTIDWALENEYPDLDFLRKEFGNCQGEGIFIDQHFNGQPLSEHQVYVFHHCTGTIRVGLNLAKKIIPMCYFANNCDMTILGFEGERMFPDRVPLYIFGENNINAKNSPSIEVRIFKHKIKKGGKR
jgi:hypothetical protein